MKEEQLEQLLNKINTIESKVTNAGALNGAFEKLILSIELLQQNQEKMATDISDIKKKILDPDDGVISRIRELERWKIERVKFIEEDMPQLLNTHRELLLWKQEKASAVIENDDNQKQELMLLKEWQRMVNKVLWGVGTAIGGIALKFFLDLLQA